MVSCNTDYRNQPHTIGMQVVNFLTIRYIAMFRIDQQPDAVPGIVKKSIATELVDGIGS